MARQPRKSRRLVLSRPRNRYINSRSLRVELLESRLCLSVAQLISHWTFDTDDISGNTVVDTAPLLNSQSGTKTNGGPSTAATSVVGQAAQFAGGANDSFSEFVDLAPHASTFGALATGTISAWVKPDVGDPTDVLTIFSVSNSTAASQEARFYVSNGVSPGVGTLVYGVRDGTSDGSITSTSTNLFDGGWHHVAVTVGAGNSAEIYIDGNPEGSGTVSFLTDLFADASAIGRNKDSTAGGGQWFFGGGIDDVGLWNDALTADELKSLFNLATYGGLNYDLGQAEQLFNLSDTGSGQVNIGGRTWLAVSGLTGPEGEVAAGSHGDLTLNLGGGVGVATPAATTGEFFDSGQALGDHHSTGISLGDLDGDGDLDAFVANLGEANRVWINQGGAQGGTPGTFSDSGQTVGDHLSHAVSLGDLDGDGDLDAFVANYGEANRVWINQGGAGRHARHVHRQRPDARSCL